MVMALFRHILTMAGAYLVSQGYIEATSVESVTGASLVLIGAGWSAYKARQNKKVIAELKTDVAIADNKLSVEKAKN